MTKDDARALLSNGGRKTSDAEVERFLAEFEKGVPVMPVTFFCEALETWARVLGESHPTERYPKENDERRVNADRASGVFLQIRKSNLLWRMIYCGEPLRKDRCPEHKGRWSGCNLPEDTSCKGVCMFGGNVTGWLP